ncbi:hypothetical protein [Nitratireductor rhodophyticola]|uniref:hypothetical protein n=1 Tax=Nitratireductor rhodophyticola TaxID=2854036 RepID=UPI00300B4265
MDANAKAAFWASGAVFRGETPVEDLIDPETLSIWRDADLSAMQEAASFFRRWPDSTPEAVCIHMRRRGLPNLPAPNRRMAAAWAVFAFTLRTLDQVTAAEKAEAEAEARAQEKRRLLVDRDRLAMTPEDDSPLSEYGKAAMRRRESPQGEKPRNDQE